MTTAYVPAEPALTRAQNIAASDLAQQLTDLLSSSGGQALRALQAMVWRVACHPKQDLAGVDYTELSVGYIAKAADVGRETARRAWHLTRKVLQWEKISASQAMARGARLRSKSEGSCWGQHLSITREATAAAIRACTACQIAEPHVGLPTGPEWVEITPRTKGRHRVTRCPWHEDHTPSMVLYPNPDGNSGSAICLACVRGTQKLTAYWRRVGDQYRIRLARTTATTHTRQTMGTIDNRGGQMPVCGATLLSTCGSRGARLSPSSAHGLVEALRVADRRCRRAHAIAYTASARMMAAPEELPYRVYLPDLYISLDQMRPSTWAPNPRKPGGWLPDRWEPSATTHLAVDLDSFDTAPLDTHLLRAESEDLGRWLARLPHCSGEVAVIRTSHHGLQAVVGLTKPQHPSWRRSPEAARLHNLVEKRLLAMARRVGFEGGKVDLTARGAGRMIRRPGPRIDKLGLPYVSHLIYSRLEDECP